MKTKIHAIAGAVGFLTILVFWTSTLATELFASHSVIAAVKNNILWGMLLLIPAMALVGASGLSLGKGRTDTSILRKKKRMPFIALNGLLVLVPSAIFLSTKANANAFDITFYTVQGVELIAGAINLTLMGLNIRDGLGLTARLARMTPAATSNGATMELSEAGPVVVAGLGEFTAADGAAIPTKSTMALCRCGRSKNKPFCDGSHADTTMH